MTRTYKQCIAGLRENGPLFAYGYDSCLEGSSLLIFMSNVHRLSER